MLRWLARRQVEAVVGSGHPMKAGLKYLSIARCLEHTKHRYLVSGGWMQSLAKIAGEAAPPLRENTARVSHPPIDSLRHDWLQLQLGIEDQWDWVVFIKE